MVYKHSWNPPPLYKSGVCVCVWGGGRGGGLSFQNFKINKRGSDFSHKKEGVVLKKGRRGYHLFSY